MATGERYVSGLKRSGQKGARRHERTAWFGRHRIPGRLGKQLFGRARNAASFPSGLKTSAWLVGASAAPCPLAQPHFRSKNC